MITFTPLDVIKSADLNANFAGLADGSEIADSTILPRHLNGDYGTDWAMQSYVPTWTNVSGGTLNHAKYMVIGNICFFSVEYTLAGAGVTGAVIVSLPVTAHADMVGSDMQVAGIRGMFLDTGTINIPAVCWLASSTTVRMRAENSAGTYIAVTADTSSTLPFTWAVNDKITLNGWYEIA